MLAKVLSGTTVGLKTIPVTVEIDIYNKSLPAFTSVGPQCQDLSCMPIYNSTSPYAIQASN